MLGRPFLLLHRPRGIAESRTSLRLRLRRSFCFCFCSERRMANGGLLSLATIGKKWLNCARALTRRYDFEAFFFNPSNKGQCEALLPKSRRPRHSEKEPLASSSPAGLWLAMEQRKSEAFAANEGQQQQPQPSLQPQIQPQHKRVLILIILPLCPSI